MSDWENPFVQYDKYKNKDNTQLRIIEFMMATIWWNESE